MIIQVRWNAGNQKIQWTRHWVLLHLNSDYYQISKTFQMVKTIIMKITLSEIVF